MKMSSQQWLQKEKLHLNVDQLQKQLQKEKLQENLQLEKQLQRERQHLNAKPLQREKQYHVEQLLKEEQQKDDKLVKLTIITDELFSIFRFLNSVNYQQNFSKNKFKK